MSRRPARGAGNRATSTQPKGAPMKSHMDPWTMQVIQAQKVASVGYPIETKVVAAPEKPEVVKTVIEPDSDEDSEGDDAVSAD